MSKVKVKVVTGYIPISGHPRTAAEYGKLGEGLKGLKCPLHPMYGVVTATWLYNMIAGLPFEPVWSVADNPQKNTLAYHCVQHEKFQWLYQASVMDKESDVFVWLDYGILHVPGVTAAVINDALTRIKRRPYIQIPGCWPRGDIDDNHPCWRFCGGFLVVPREFVQPLKNLLQALVLLHVTATKRVTWEVNSLARAEQTEKVPIHWYAADHDQTMFTELK